MRVIHVVTAFPRHAGDPITPWLVELVRRQRAAGIDASVLAPAYRGGPAAQAPSGAGAPAAPAAGDDCVPVERFRYAPRRLETLTHDESVPEKLRRRPVYGLLVPPYLVGGVRAARRIGRSRSPDIVHVHWPMPHALTGAAMRRASSGRTAMVCSYYSVEIRWIQSRLRPLVPFLRWTARTADEVTAISEATAAGVRTLVDRPVAIIPYGAATTTNAVGPPARPALSNQANQPVRILFVGRLVERKGVEVLVRAIASGRFARPVELHIVGAGEWEERIRAAIDAAGHDESESSAGERVQMRMLGRLSAGDLRREYEAADIFVLPAVRDAKGDTEGLGVVLLEALGFERPVIASDIGGIPDIVRDGDTGLLVPPGDAGALAAAIGTLIDDPQRARVLARRGRVFTASAFGWESVVQATREAYGRAAEARSRALNPASRPAAR